MLRMPEPDRMTLNRRCENVAALWAILPDEGAIDDPASLRPY